MTEIIFVIIGIIVATGLLLGSIITTYCYCKRYKQNRLTENAQSIKQQREEDYLHSVIINQHIARHLRPNSAVSFISNNYHNEMTLIAPPRRLALLEQQQKQHDPAVLVIENPILSSSSNHTTYQRTPSIQTFVYENPTLELGESTTTSTVVLS